MKKYIIILLLCSVAGFSQKKPGIVQYDYKLDYIKLIESLTFMDEIEKERFKLTWGSRMNDGNSTKYQLFFNEDQSFYTYGEQDNTNSFYSRRTDDLYFVNNFKDQTTLEYLTMLGKSYLIEDSLPKYKWKVLNELKEIDGHLCMKASVYDSVKNYEVVAWFAADIPISAGPENYYGLPGLILELDLNDGTVLVEATKIQFEEVAERMILPKKMKGKNIDLEQRDELIRNHIRDSQANKMNPYWSLRY